MSKQESYTKEYRGEAVKLVLEQGMTMKTASELRFPWNLVCHR